MIITSTRECGAARHVLEKSRMPRNMAHPSIDERDRIAVRTRTCVAHRSAPAIDRARACGS
jgi:hypothetical protein